MQNFRFENETKIIFGKDTELEVATEVSKYGQKILLHYGGGSIKKTGLYDKVIKSLNDNDISYVELSGVKPNPRLSLVKEGIDICRKEDIDFILAVGGGSVIDSAKAIAAGVKYLGDVWDFFDGKAEVGEAIPIGTILTIPATGSETGDGTVLTNEEGWFKRSMSHKNLRPKFAILNPELTYSLPDYQTAAGGVDIMSHVFERYFTNTLDVDLTDKLCEATLRCMIKNLPIALENPTDYAARADIMWSGTIAHNGLLGTGRVEDWGSHMIAHEISAMYDLTHGATLAIVFPAWMKYVCLDNVDRFVQFAVRVWNVEMNFQDPKETAFEGIERTKEFFKKVGLPVSLSDAGISSEKIEEMAEKCTKSGSVGNLKKLNKRDVIKILNMAL